jgi:hypothetical protein
MNIERPIISDIERSNDGNSLIFITNSGKVNYTDAITTYIEFREYLETRFSKAILRLRPHKFGETILRDDDLDEIITKGTSRMVGIKYIDEELYAIILIPTPKHPRYSGYYDVISFAQACVRNIGAEKFFLRALQIETHPEYKVDEDKSSSTLLPCHICKLNLVRYGETWCGHHVCEYCLSPLKR